MRLKLQMGAAPGILEKDLSDKIRVEESVCKVLRVYHFHFHPLHITNSGNCEVSECLQE